MSVVIKLKPFRRCHCCQVGLNKKNTNLSFGNQQATIGLMCGTMLRVEQADCVDDQLCKKCLFQPKPETESEKILDEVRRQVSKCTCVKQFKIHKIGEGKYRVSTVWFGYWWC